MKKCATEYPQPSMHITARKMTWYGHVTRSTGLAKSILQCTVPGGKQRGRQTKTWENNILFATSHGVNTEFPSERRRAKKKMPGEMAGDDCLTGLARFKADTFMVVLDEAYLTDVQQISAAESHTHAVLSLFTHQVLLSELAVLVLK